MDYNNDIINQLKLDMYERIQEAKVKGIYHNSNKLIQVVDASSQVVIKEFKTKKATADWLRISDTDMKKYIDNNIIAKGRYIITEIWLSNKEMEDLFIKKDGSVFC